MRYHNITHDDMLNGDGLRVVLWVSGCEHHCPECQNPVTWDPDDGILFDSKAFEELDGELEKDYISGITYSGGDPLHPRNIEEITKLAKRLHERHPLKTQWLYTGYTYEKVQNLPVFEYIDVVVDGEFVKKLADKLYKWAGSTNQRVIDVKKSRETGKIVLHANDILPEKEEKHDN